MSGGKKNCSTIMFALRPSRFRDWENGSRDGGISKNRFLRRRVEMKDAVEGRHGVQVSARAILAS